MIIARTPFRISFFGGGTDYPDWYRKEGGVVLSTTIDKYCHVTCRYLPPFFLPVRHRIVWSKLELLERFEDIAHPAIRGGLQYLQFDNSRGLEIHHQGDLPARSGMGSSSAFAVCLLKALYALRGQMVDKMTLAREAIHLEQNILHESVGCQDQIATAFGGFNVIRFGANDDFQIEPLIIPHHRLKNLNDHLLMIFTGTSRNASEVAQGVVANIPQNGERLRKMHQLVHDAVEILTKNDNIEPFGELLHETWMQKKNLSDKVSNSEIDAIYETARNHGAIGGKLLGAGSSGFMLFFVPPKKRASVQMALAQYLEVPFEFENQGSTIIHYRPWD